MYGISHYQVDMIKKNIVKGLAKINIVSGEIRYDLRELEVLKRCSIKDVIDIIRIIKEGSEFFLYGRNYILEQDRIYKDKRGRIKLLYMPVKEYANRSMNQEAFIQSAVRFGIIRENILKYSNSGQNSFLAFNMHVILYLLSFIVIFVPLALIFSRMILLALPVLIPAPLIVRTIRRTGRKMPAEGRTVILSERDMVSICFSDVFGNEQLISVCEHEIKYIGRDSRACALCICNGAVGRKHARMSYTDGKVIMMDNDSLNGTYLNSGKMKRNRPYEVRDGDKVIFADEEYMIMIKS